MDGVVPLAVECVSHQIDGGELLIGDFDPGGIRVGVEFGRDGESTLGSGVGDQVEHHFVTDEGLTLPIHADKREEPVFDLVPLGGPRGKVTDCDRNLDLVSEFLDLKFEESNP